MKPTSIHLLLSLSTCFFSVSCFSQNMNSPYSVYGIGDIDNMVYNRTTGMGGTGLALKTTTSLINNNPAAIAGMPRSFYMVNIAATGKIATYSGTPVNAGNQSNKDFWVRGLSLTSKLNKWWAAGVGFRQFSNVNYKFIGQKQIEGTSDSYLTGYTGDGGLNEYYFTNAFSLGKHFSIGIKSSVVSGGINLTETIADANSGTNIISKQQDYYGNARFEYGAIYNTALNKKWDFSIGGKFINKTNLPADRTLTVTEGTTNIVTDKYVSTNPFYLPITYGGGFALTHNKKTTFAADYTFENWSPLKLDGTGWSLVNSKRLSAGVEFASLEKRWNQTIEKKFFQAGGFIGNSYMQVNNQPINEFGITGGTGGNINNLLYSVSAEVGKRGTTTANLIKENYFKLTLTLSYRDLILSKGRRYD